MKNIKNWKVTLIIALWSIILILIGGVYAYWSWQSTNEQNTSVTFTVNGAFACSGDAGGNITSDDVILRPATCTDTSASIQ